MENKIYSQPDQIIDDDEQKEEQEKEENKGEESVQNKELEKKLKKYEDLGGLSTKKLNFGLWYAKHAIQIKRIINISLILVSFASWSFTIYSYAHYYFIGAAEDEKITAELTAPNLVSHTFFLRKSSKELALSNVSYIKTSQDKHDLYIKIQNSNENYWAEFDYCFNINGQNIDCGKNFILPDEEKHIMALAQEVGGNARAAIFNINNIVWRRINPHKIIDWDSYEKEHTDITIDNINFTPPKASGLSEKINLGVLSFTATNNTAYSYWDVGFNILLYRGNSVAGVNRYKLSEFMSGETEEITISWPAEIKQTSGVDVEVEINILDNDNYIDPEGGVGEIK